MIVHPLTARAFVTNALKQGVDAWLQEQGSDVRVLDRVYPSRKNLIPAGWPYIVVSGGEEAQYDEWADEITLARDKVLARWLMSSQAVPLGIDIEEYVAALDGALQASLCDVLFPSPLGIVHGCRLLSPYRPPLYGDDEEQICEMGWFVQVTST